MERTPENGCRMLVEVCADLKSHETALIISDPTTQDLGAMLMTIASTVSKQVKHEIIPVAEMHGKEPPQEIAEKMKQADVIFGLTKMSMAHTQARYLANEKGARYLSLPDYTLELLTRPALFVDFRELTLLSEKIARAFTESKHIKLTSALGTCLTLDISGRTGNAAPGWCNGKGTLASPPDAEANVPPVEDKTEGVLIVDGSIPCKELGILKSPLTLHVQQGKIIKVEGEQADVLNRVLDRLGTDATRVAAEFGIGLNPKAELIGSMLEDEGCLGTVHIGFGSNITIGGKNKVAFHLDHIIRDATIYLDGKLIMENGSIEPFKQFEQELMV